MGVVGVGATGIQVIPTIAEKVAHLAVFARSPQYVLPMENPAYDAGEQAAWKAQFGQLKKAVCLVVPQRWPHR